MILLPKRLSPSQYGGYGPRLVAEWVRVRTSQGWLFLDKVQDDTTSLVFEEDAERQLVRMVQGNYAISLT
ncbi:hypothetical protein TNCV_2237771 [Trichonephila clavipes]|nr:hypothetical protein TNCV_2237771 [Trichonephila clavipes]